ncbi:PREDICTED: angiotensin-converting enzyme [Drosophila arizonae]|uniref:Angiotensin-converting enzyme n=1 Tax=Drosophila arizonae TaxID=7263 RepID=A0ABM1NVG0_DROAR|nr:PREDICTED: angiotensin-converting enzyme [Drosophila arizonae]XP_017858947.1 PREDICTED: angiotensin-converting enzyme [Drosophila arizonae]
MWHCLFIICSTLWSTGLANPQLNLPTPQPEIFYNGYTPNVATTPAQLRADRDRSQRYGPPYAENEGGTSIDDGLDDFRYGQTYDERMRLGYAYPTPRLNFSDRADDSPFSADQQGNRGQDNRYANHNYGPTSSSTERNYGNFNDQPNYNVYNPNPNANVNYNNLNDPYVNNGNVEFVGNDRNRFQSPYQSNQDRFNLNQGYQERQRYQQDRRYQQELEKLRNLLVETDQKGSLECTANVAAQWNFETNVNDYTQTEALNAQQRYVEYQRITAEQSKRINKDLIFDRRLYRQLMLQSEVGPNSLSLDVLDRYNRLLNEMLFLYNDASICAYQQPFQCDLHYIPHLKDIMAKSRDWDELQHTWVEYHRKAGRGMRDNYEQLIDVMQDVAAANNVSNGGEYWFLAYESGNFRQDMDIVWEQIRPLYESLHSYVRRKLRDYYGPDRINRIAPIPSHILGNMYGQSWSNVLDILIPYPGRKLIDVTPRMVEQGYTPLLMFQLAEEFFTSINMSAVGPEFYRNSLFEQPLDRRVLCEPSAWDFCNRHDFRVKMCTDINQRSLVSVHHEMAHIQYFLQYRHLPKVFRNGANPAFHQAVGDAIGLSVSTPKHLQTLGLLQRSLDESSYDINYLFTMAIDKVAFLPFALSLDNWRYDVFSGNANKRVMNCHYWNLREKYSGIKPPVLRSEMDFDVGAKYHIPANIPYIKYFFSTVLQFQLYRSMCRAAGQYVPNDPRKPLHKCDIYRQPAAGNLLKQLMAKGASQPWQEVLQETLGEGRLDGSALREYFAPLEEWLRQEALRTNEYVGWNYDGDYCKRSIETAGLQIFGGYYNAAASPLLSLLLLGLSSWLSYSLL